jgi:hypothetical protein
MVSPSAALIQFMAKHHTRNHVKKISKWIQIEKNQYNYRKETNEIENNMDININVYISQTEKRELKSI